MPENKPANVTRIAEWKHKDTIEALEYLLAMAKRGEITGFIYGVRVGDWHHGIGVTGHYRDDPIAGLGATGRIFSALNRLAEQASE